MSVLIGVDRHGGNGHGFVALIDGVRTVRAANLHELAQNLLSLGIDSHSIRLAAADDGDHAMSLTQQAEFRIAWQVAAASNAR